MAKLIIKDLTDSIALDREAMAAIVGGARVGARSSIGAPLVPPATRVVEYPPGFAAAHQRIADAGLPRKRQRR